MQPTAGPTRVRELVRETGVYLALGSAERRSDEMHNSVLVLSPDGTDLARYSKTHTAFDEPYNTQGSELPVFDTPKEKCEGGRIRLSAVT